MIVTMGSATSSRLNQFRGVPVNSVHRFMYKVKMAGLLARKIVSGLFVYKKVCTQSHFLATKPVKEKIWWLFMHVKQDCL